MNLAGIVYQLLLALVVVNLVLVFGLSFIPGIILAVLVIAILSGIQFGIQNTNLTITALSIAGFLALVGIALAFSIPSWQIISQQPNSGSTGQFLPLLFAAIGLYATTIWLSTVSASRLDTLDWLANFLTGPALHISLLTALVMATAAILGLDWLDSAWESSQSITKRFLDRGIIPPVTILLFFWGILILIGKWWNSLYVRNVVDKWQNKEETKAENNVDRVHSLIYQAEKIDDRLSYLWNRHEQSFLIPRYISWAVPVLGFIGTVLGISLAADGIRSLIGSDSGLAGLSSELGNAIAPLGIAFDTTLIALTLSLFLTLLLALVQRSEERTLSSLERQLREEIGG